MDRTESSAVKMLNFALAAFLITLPAMILLYKSAT